MPMFFLTVFFITAVLAPYIAPHSPTEGKLTERLQAPTWLGKGSQSHPLGTDRLGRDYLSRLVYGARISLILVVLAIPFSGVIGTALGLLAGYHRGKIDALIMRLADMGLAMPTILMAILLAAALGASFTNVILVIVLLLWPRYARQVRGEALSLREQDFVMFARVAGCSPWRIMLWHIFPGVVPSLLVLATLQVGYVIILESSLSFLGVGIPPPNPAWGIMIAEGRGFMTTAWWLTLFPGIAIALTVLSMNLVGDWLRDYLDPKLRQI